MNIAKQIIDIASNKGLSIATAESCTGGMVSAAITDIPGSSAVFERGFVSYSNRAKIELLGVSPKSLETYGAVSEQVAAEMAMGALQQADTNIAVSVTGIAGPGGSPHKPEGRVCFGLAQKGDETKSEMIDFGALGREKVRQQATDFALSLLLSAVNGPE